MACKHDKRELIGETGFIEWCPCCGALCLFQGGRWVWKFPRKEA